MKSENIQLLRFTTAGSVDDGKSTLIGRLLYDSKSIFEDQLDAVAKSSARKGHKGVDLAMFTDGLRDEREQGITIDVAYRYFATPKRKFIIADTPGHIQYTRNMVTGASTANAAILLIDARNGVVEQTKRHSYIASLLQISHVIVCVNKMDLVDWSETRYNEIVSDYKAIASKMLVKNVHYIPMSALYGDNVVQHSEKMEWYHGAPLLQTLEELSFKNDFNKIDARFSVQSVIRPQSNEFPDFRGYAGRISSGVFRQGDAIVVLPSGLQSVISSIEFNGRQLAKAHSQMSVIISLQDDIDVSRGNMIAKTDNPPQPERDFEAMICWLNDKKVQPRAKFSIIHTTNEQKAIIKGVDYKINIQTLERDSEDKEIGMNDICRVKIRTTQPLMLDSYNENRSTGSFILIDDSTNETVAAGMIL